MIKLMFTWKDNPALTPEACEAHYRSNHMVLARQAFDGVEGFQFLAYSRVRSHRVNDHNEPTSHQATPDFDAFIEIYFDTRAHLDEAMKGPVLPRMFADHENFMAVDIPANIKIYELDEEVILGQHPG